MGSDCRIVVFGSDASKLVDAAVQRVAELERRWSRFLPDSEISQLNRAAGSPMMVSPETYLLVERAVFASAGTRGWFDPTMLSDLRQAGYDRSHELLAPAAKPGVGSGPGSAPCSPRPGPAADAIRLDPELWSITLPAGVEFDPGGIGKGLAADLVTDLLLEADATRTLVDLGGDIRVTDMYGEPWAIEVDDPFDPGHSTLTLALANGGVATSSRLRRRWTTPSGATRHHLLDPQTRLPSTTELVAVTAAAGEAWWAEVLAKSALLAGPSEGGRLVSSNQGAAGLFTEAGQLLEAGGFLNLRARTGSSAEPPHPRTKT
ncbi:MAG: FAD:protein FMN transferase [Actinomycetia bacterium]|nr:FAD:protein FMN transferase [Actinomycetes bacterium]